MASAVDNGMIPTSPCRRVRLPRIPEADPRILNVADVDRVASRCEPADRVLVLLLAYGGLRVGEALPLSRRHIDLTGGRLTIAEAVSELPVARLSTHPRATNAVS